jgi:hypothetical protein
VRLRRVGLTPDSPRADRLPFQGNALFAGRFWFVRTEVLLRACRRSGVRPAAAVTPTPAATPRSCGQRPPARYQQSRYLGASPVSVRKPGGQPRPAPRQPPASHGAQSRELLRRRRPTQRRGPHNGDLVSPESHGVITEGVAFHRQAGVLRAPPGLGCWLSSKAGVPRQALVASHNCCKWPGAVKATA